MSLDKTVVERIAWLARLALRPDEVESYRQDLSRILALVAEMNTVDTSNVAPLAHPLELGARLRPDEVTESDQRDLFQSIAPACADGYYLVPKVIE
jgi:aspartyl-tRNA(Asn)/glutamyl-tRNA(Gln) amidotransferase subunit C